MTVAVLVITDGRDECLAETVASAQTNLMGAVRERWMFDDTGDPDHREMLRKAYPRFTVIDGGPRQGFGGAIRYAWKTLLERSNAEHVFHLEGDFTFNVMINLWALERVLETQPHLVQVALLRQPWNEEEKAAGGIIECHPDDYREVCDGSNTWREHRRFFTTNPCMYRRSLMERGWPDVEHSEGHFSIELFKDPTARSAFWGTNTQGPWVNHIGLERVGVGY